ncbi:MAG: hypothetical protein ACOYBY_17720 [Dermatophilaceae bacterium]
MIAESQIEERRGQIAELVQRRDFLSGARHVALVEREKVTQQLNERIAAVEAEIADLEALRARQLEAISARVVTDEALALGVALRARRRKVEQTAKAVSAAIAAFVAELDGYGQDVTGAASTLGDAPAVDEIGAEHATGVTGPDSVRIEGEPFKRVACVEAALYQVLSGLGGRRFPRLRDPGALLLDLAAEPILTTGHSSVAERPAGRPSVIAYDKKMREWTVDGESVSTVRQRDAIEAYEYNQKYGLPMVADRG